MSLLSLLPPYLTSGVGGMVLKSFRCEPCETAILPLCSSLRCHHSLANMPMFRSPSSSSVLPIFYPNMYERDQVQEVDPEAQATGSTSLTMHPGILLGLSEYYCKATWVVLRAYLVSVFLVRGGRRTVSCSVDPCCDQLDTLALCSFAPSPSRFWSLLTRCLYALSALPGRLPLRPGLPEPRDAGRAVQRGPAVLPGDAAQLLHAGHDLAQAHRAAAQVL
jgi:hypothetical protein